MTTKKKLSRSQYIKNIFLLHSNKKFSCMDITKMVIKHEKTDRVTYMSGSVSSKLRKLVVDGFLEYDSETTLRGGHLYKLKK